MVRNSDRNRLFSPTSRMKPAKLDAAPVSVSTPMMTPTMAQATPTGSACCAPSTRLLRISVQRLAAALDDEVGDHAAPPACTTIGHDAVLEEAGGAETQRRSRTRSGRPSSRNARGDADAEDQDGGERQADHAGEHRREAVEQHAHQHRQRQQQVPASRLIACQGFGHSSLGRPIEARAPGFEVHHPEGGDVIEDGRNDRRLDDLDVGHVERLGHDEGDRAHHRRHDLAAHAGGGLDRAGEHRRVAEALHQRDGELADGQHVGDARSRRSCPSAPTRSPPPWPGRPGCGRRGPAPGR